MNIIPSDYHLHSYFSGDSNADMDDIAQSAISCNMKSFCITDHLDFDYPNDTNLFMLDGDSYFEKALILKEKYRDVIDIRIGIETGLEPDKNVLLDKFISRHNYDFVIGSSHLVHRADPYYPEYFEGRTDYDAFKEYFDSILENLDTCSNFDVYGHLDYVVRYSPNKAANFSYSIFSDIIDEILKRLIAMNKGIELNTAGFRKGLNAPNPSIDIIKKYRQLGGEIITIGSDAHVPTDIGSMFDTAADILKACNFKYYTTFKNRRPEFNLLD